MSYNPSTIRVRKMEDFCLPIERLNAVRIQVVPPSRDYNPDESFNLTMPDEFALMDWAVTYVPGEEYVTVVDLDMDNEWYRMDYDIIVQLFKGSLGYLEYVIVWESGDSVEIVTFQNGKMTTETII